MSSLLNWPVDSFIVSCALIDVGKAQDILQIQCLSTILLKDAAKPDIPF